MAGVYINKADSLEKKATDKGYCVGWKSRSGFERSRLDGEMTFGEAQKKAAELSAKEPNKVFWAEMLMEPKFEKH
jgi:hypothetical protein